jgi:hypothetical protein
MIWKLYLRACPKTFYFRGGNVEGGAMGQYQQHALGDVAFVENRREPRIILSIPARYIFADRRDANGGQPEFSGRLINISAHAMALFAPIIGEIGERVITQSDEFGRLEGSIARVLDHGFAVTIDASSEMRSLLEIKIKFYENIKNHDLQDRRVSKRIVPPDPNSTLIFADNSRVKCSVIDISATGAAVSAEITPPIGTPLAVGKLVGRVVRHFSNGFAVQFI